MAEIDRALAGVEETLARSENRQSILLATGGDITPEQLEDALDERAAMRASRATMLGAGSLIPGRGLPTFGLERD